MTIYITPSDKKNPPPLFAPKYLGYNNTMKIIIGTESFLPNLSGVSIASRNLAENLTEAGHEAIVLCPGDKNETFVDPNFKDYTVYRVKSMRNPFRKGYRITSTTKNELRQLISKIKPNLIHIQDVAILGLELRNIANSLGIPIIATNHFSLEFATAYVKFSPFIPLARRALIDYLRSFYNKCTLITTPTETIAKQIYTWGVKKPIMAISNGINYQHFARPLAQEKILSFKLRYNLPNKPLVIYAGRVDKDKSIDVILNAVPKVVKKTDAHFVFAGSGDLIAIMENQAKRLGVEGHVHFIGKIDNKTDDYRALYRAGTVFAIASLIETQSLVTLEAMASGLPVSAVRFNALPEIVKQNINGLLFAPGDSNQLANNLIRIISNKALQHKMSLESQKIASNQEISKTFKIILELYEKLTSPESIN